MKCPYKKRVPLKASKEPKPIEVTSYLPATVLVPCGRCMYCESQIKLQWLWRMEQESRDFDPWEVCFHTFTYDDLHLGDPNDWSLLYKHLQYTFREYRRKTNNSFRYFAVGEYGAKSYRPHFHAITWGIQDVQYFHSRWKNGFTYPRYYDNIPPVETGHLQYMVNYLDKPMHDTIISEYPDWEGIREMRHMSKGIGRNYKLTRDQIDEFVQKGTITVSTEANWHVQIPKYWTDKLKQEQLTEEGRARLTAKKVEYGEQQHEKLLRTLEAQGVTYEQFLNRMKWQEQRKRNKKSKKLRLEPLE